MRRRALLQAGALSAALASAGCLASVQQSVNGRVYFDYGHSDIHRADEPYVRGGLDDESDAWTAGRLFTEPPTDPVFTDRVDADEEGGFVDDVRDVDYDRRFVLLFEARMTADDPYRVGPGPVLGAEPRWTGWRELTLPLEYQPEDSLGSDLADAKQLVCTLVVHFVTHPEEEPLRTKPESATVELYDDEGSRRGGTVTVTAGESS
ncbi:hypothetical protein ACFO0N_13025 [Halobium salinum]|uniref:Lipoprotein n=1 Tax=Halobium salinum TaxID=1364940 RepID=A0ABD5PDB7_9EURY|nr:hypothetical protein [Halobium salinum]